MAGYFSKRPPKPTTKNVNIGFILLNKDTLTIQQMANRLDVSTTTIHRIIKDYKMEYKKKQPFFTKYKKIEDICHF